MLQLYITSTDDVGFYFLYDPVKDDIHEGSFISYENAHDAQTLQTQALHDAFIHLANARVLSRHEGDRTDILLHAPVKIYIENRAVRNQFKSPWKYAGLWKIIAQKRRQLKYFDIQKDYVISELPAATQAIFNSHLSDIQLYRDEHYAERVDADDLTALGAI